jgi:hypothetical protein
MRRRNIRKVISTTSGLCVLFAALQVATCLGYFAGVNCTEEVGMIDPVNKINMIAESSTEWLYMTPCQLSLLESAIVDRQKSTKCARLVLAMKGAYLW